jgi:TetR/AcrR family transcriptional regulator
MTAETPAAFAESVRTAGAAETVERILKAAETLFAERGFEAVSMNEIAEAAGVSKASIFHHFDSKHALYLEVVRQACATTAERLERLAGGRGGLRERLARFCEEQLAQMLARENVLRLIKRELLRKESELGRMLAEQVFSRHFAELTGILRAAQARGELRRQADPVMIATVLIGAQAFFAESRAVLRHLPGVSFADDPARYTHALVELLLEGAQVRAAETR